MLKRQNPYRKTRTPGTLDDLMFDMDKRRHTSFRFQNYQNFITDRPGKMVSSVMLFVLGRKKCGRNNLTLAGFFAVSNPTSW